MSNQQATITAAPATAAPTPVATELDTAANPAVRMEQQLLQQQQQIQQLSLLLQQQMQKSPSSAPAPIVATPAPAPAPTPWYGSRYTWALFGIVLGAGAGTGITYAVMKPVDPTP